MTTPLASNVRGFEPATQRLRGAQREGQTKFMAAQLVGNFPIQDLNVVTTTNFAPQGGVGVFAHPLNNATPNGITVEFWIAGGKFSITSTLQAALGQMYGAVWDNNANLYALFNNGGTATTVVCLNLSAPVAAMLASGGNTALTGTVTWTKALVETVNKPVGIDLGGGFVWIALQQGATSHTALYQLNQNTGTVVTGGPIFSHANVQSARAANWLRYCNGTVAVGYGAGGDGSNGSVDTYNTITGVNTYHNGAAALDVVDITTDGYGHFYFLNCDDSTAFWLTAYDTYGNMLASPAQLLTGPNAHARALCYDPVSTNLVVVSHAAVGGFDIDIRSTIAANNFSQVAATASGLTNHCLGISPDGAGGFFVSTVAAAGGGLTWARFSSVNPVTTIQGPDASRVTPTTPMSPAVFQGYESLLPNVNSFFIRGIGVSGGTVARFTTAGPITVAGGANALAAAPPVIFSAQQGAFLYFVDGTVYKRYNINKDVVEAWTASQGAMPFDAQGNPARLMVNWRNRIVLTGFRYNPFLWWMSALGDATNWQTNPTPIVETEAIEGDLSAAGPNQDVITALIPYSDELLIFGGSKTLYQMTGDPAAGGRLDQISNSIGMAWGAPWCRDGLGNVYFMSNRGTIYQFTPGAPPQRMSDPIQQLLVVTNQNTNLVRMLWDERMLGFHVWITPIGGPAAATHYFWDSRNQAWFQDTYANNNHNPLAVCLYESGDATLRFILLGGQDGFIRYLNPSAADDDGTAIASSVYMALQEKRGMPFEVCDLECSLATTTTGTVSWNVRGARDAQLAFTSPEQQASGTFPVAGRNRSQFLRVFGHQSYVVLTGPNQVGQSWALEKLMARLRVIEGTRVRRF